MPAHEIIDLTTESHVPLTINPLDSGASRDSRKPKKKKKYSNSKSSSTRTPEILSTPSLSDSNERDAKMDHPTKRKRIRETPGFSAESNENLKRDSGRSDKTDSTDLFFVDLSPTVIPSIPVPQGSSSTMDFKNKEVEKLLLPSHVTVFGNTLVEIISRPNTDDDQFIKYLDYEDTRNVPRYYDEAPDQTAALDRTVCKNCGAEGEHKTSACPIQICLTCGVRNEHSTRSCPISKVCFSCGMKGHINANCPNRRSGRAYMAVRDDDCSRCFSTYHKTNECPTWWRLYEYLASEDQAQTLARRQSKKGIILGQGGEGYIADDEWCYNCGNPGHWGDDCYDPSSARSPGEYSAFSNNNVMMGPFYDPSQEPKSTSSRPRTRDWGQVDQMGNWGNGAPDRVGQRARMKSMAALEKKSREAEEDPDDWFGKKSTTALRHPLREPKKISFGKTFNGERQYASSADQPPSLLSRLSGDYHPSNSRSHETNGHYESRQSRKSRNGNNSRHQREERSGSSSFANGRRQDIPTGPRYKGGYAR